MIKRQTKTPIGTRAHIPAWLSNPNLAAPCICGMPPDPRQEVVMGMGEYGMRRWFHESCWDMIMSIHDDEDDEMWDDDED